MVNRTASIFARWINFLRDQEEIAGYQEVADYFGRDEKWLSGILNGKQKIDPFVPRLWQYIYEKNPEIALGIIREFFGIQRTRMQNIDFVENVLRRHWAYLMKQHDNFREILQ